MINDIKDIQKQAIKIKENTKTAKWIQWERELKKQLNELREDANSWIIEGGYK
jgi:hypothetical protein